MNEVGVDQPDEETVAEERDDLRATVDPVKVRLLAVLLDATARDEAEQTAFHEAFQCALAELEPIDMLYAELEGLLDGEGDARTRFLELLDLTADAFGATTNTRASAAPLWRSPSAPRGAALRCKPQYLVDPGAILDVLAAIPTLTGGDTEARRRYEVAIGGLWQRADRLDALYECAVTWPPARRAPALRMLLDGPGRVRDLSLRGPSGPPPWPPGPAPWPRLPPADPCALRRELCRHAALSLIGKLLDIPAAVDTDAITSVAPAVVCPGEQLHVHGAAFGDPPPGLAAPAGSIVKVGPTQAEIVSWSDAEIVVTAPDVHGPMCVGLSSDAAEAARIAAHDRNEHLRAGFADGVGGECFGFAPYHGSPLPPSLAPCTGVNGVWVGPPTIDYFTLAEPASWTQEANGDLRTTIETGSTLTLMWSVTGAASIRVSKVAGWGPPLDLDDPPGTAHGLGQITVKFPVTLSFRLTASNRCGEVAQTIVIGVGKTPGLRVIGIEIVQSIQRFSLLDPASGNSVRLVEGKRTVARVYVDSGIIDAFDSGSGPGLQPHVTGTVTVRPAGTSAAALLAPAPFNFNDEIVARPLGGIDRRRADHSLNFELPLRAIHGTRTVTADVRVKGHGGAGWTASGSTTVEFPARPGQFVQPVLCGDRHQRLHAPDLTEFNAAMAGARTRFPLPEGGMIARPPISTETLRGGFPFPPDEDLRTEDGWDNLLSRVAITLLAARAAAHGVLTVLVPTSPPAVLATGERNPDRYALNGLAQPSLASYAFFGGVMWVQRAGTQVSQAGLPATFAHELAHLAGADHTTCGNPPPPYDPRLPENIEEPAFDVSRHRLLSDAQKRELMGVCGQQERWPSIALYDIMYDSFPIS